MLGLPAGSLQDATIRLFEKAGWKITKDPRSYRPSFDDPELRGRFVRAQEISRYVESGFFDAGLTGLDWVLENNSQVVVVTDLVYSRTSPVRARWVVAVPENSPICSVADLEGKRIATEALQLTRSFLAKHGVEARVEFSWGATEVKVPDLVDAIVEITETGGSLRANNLRIVDTVLYTNTQLIANTTAWEEDIRKRKKIENLGVLLRAALEAESRVGLKLNCPKSNLDALLQELPALRKPTVSRLADDDWVAVETVLEEMVVREIIPLLQTHGAEGIIEYPLNKVVL